MADFENVLTDIATGADLSHYAAVDALKVLVGNWEAVIADAKCRGWQGIGNIGDIIDQDLQDTITVLQNAASDLIAAAESPAPADSSGAELMAEDLELRLVASLKRDGYNIVRNPGNTFAFLDPSGCEDREEHPDEYGAWLAADDHRAAADSGKSPATADLEG